MPGGFGSRGTEGMIEAIRWARENKRPFLGICLGMQLAVIEFARNVCNLMGATSTEFDKKATEPIVIDMPELDRTKMGGTMRPGLRTTHFQPISERSKICSLYAAQRVEVSSSSPSPPPSLQDSPAVGTVSLSGTLILKGNGAPSQTGAGAAPELIVHERHRHRYEVNLAYISILAEHGLHFFGKDNGGKRMEVLELGDHPWFVGVQFHPRIHKQGPKTQSANLGLFCSERRIFGQGPKRDQPA